MIAVGSYLAVRDNLASPPRRIVRLFFYMTLNDLHIGQTAVIAGHNLPRLGSMGIQSGKSIKVIRYSPGNTVLHCRIGSVEFAIRRSVAEQILLAT